MATPHPTLLPLIQGDALPSNTRITPELISSAEEHGVAALVDAEIRRRDLPIEPELAARLAASTTAAAQANEAALNALAAVHEAAQQRGIEFAAFNGLTTAARWYESPATHPTSAVDIFVSPLQLDSMGDLPVALGDESPDVPIINPMAASGRVFEHVIPVAGTSVILHRDPMDMALTTRTEVDMWEDTVLVVLPNGLEVQALSLEWSIVQTLLESMRNSFALLLHAFDLGRMFDQDPDWERVASIAAAEGWTDIVGYALAIVCDVLGRPSPLPRKVARWRLSLIESAWDRDLFFHGSDSPGASGSRQHALSLLTKGRNPALVGDFMKRLAPPREVIDLRAGPSDDPYPVALFRWRFSQSQTGAGTQDT